MNAMDKIIPEQGSLARTRLAVAVIFFLNGFQLGSWAPEIPLVKERHGLSDVDLGFALLVLAVGAAIAMPFSGMLIARFGSAPVTKLASLLQLLALPCAVLAPSYALLLIAAFLFGAATGLGDVGMNAQAVVVEKGLKRPIMSSLHGMFSVGAALGAGAGGPLMAHFGSAFHVGLILVLSLSFFLLARAYLLPAAADRGAKGSGFALPSLAVMVIGLLTFTVFLTEGAMIDWTAIYLQEELGASAALAGAGYAAFSTGMAVSRLSGDWIRAFCSAVFLVRLGAFAASAALLSSALPAFFGPSAAQAMPLLASLGFAVAGLGLANIVPILFSAAGRMPGQPPATAVAAVATTGYFGLLAGPALISFMAEYRSLAEAFLLLSLLIFAVGFAARMARHADAG